MLNLVRGVLVCGLLYPGHGWLDSRAQNLKLRTHILALKRPLTNRRG